MAEVKRLNYFTGQFLEERDFKDEQAYHVSMRRRHNSLQHSWGIAAGLTVERSGDHTVTIQPGMAIDHLGREMVLDGAVQRDLSAQSPHGHAYLAVRYIERKEDQQPGQEHHTRIRELPDIDVHPHQPPADGSVIVLARVQFDADGHVGAIDASVRRLAGAKLARGSVAEEHLADHSVTEEKLAEEVRARFGVRGWVRLAFKPAPLERVRIDFPDTEVRDIAPEMEIGFIPGVGYARCGPRGARGSMSIPVPAGARYLRGLRLAGWATGPVEFTLFRAGWKRDRCEEVELLKDQVAPTSGRYFNHHSKLDQQLDDDDALAIMVVARASARIFLVAARFD